MRNSKLAEAKLMGRDGGQHGHGAISPNFSSASFFFPHPFSLVLELFSYSWIIFSIGRWIFQTFSFFMFSVFFSLYITARPDDAFQSPWTSFSTAPHPQTERYHTRHSVLCTYPARLISWMFLLWVMTKMGFFLVNYSWVFVVLAVHFTWVVVRHQIWEDQMFCDLWA